MRFFEDINLKVIPDSGCCGIIFVCLLILVSTVFPSSAGAKPGFMYCAQLNFRGGYHFFGQSDTWVSSMGDAVEEEFLFQDEDIYTARDVPVGASDKRTGMPFFSVEWLMGIKLAELPFLGDVSALKDFRGFRFGLGFSGYAFTSLEQGLYSGAIVYINTAATGDVPGEVNYTGTINYSEKFFAYIPGISLNYYHEKGIFDMKGLVPYAGIDLGLNILSGERRYTLDTDETVESNGGIYQAQGRVQESFYNAISFRTGVNLGLQYNVVAFHNIDFRAGYVYNETDVTLDRTGSWDESINGAAYSRRITDKEKNVTFRQSGFSFSLGYSVGLF